MLTVVAGPLCFFDEETEKGVGGVKILYQRARSRPFADELTVLGRGLSRVLMHRTPTACYFAERYLR